MINLILIFMFSLWCIDWFGSIYANRILMYFCIKSSIGTQDKLASCKSALNPPVVFSPFSIVITPLWEEIANLSAFRTFDRFMLVWICRFPLPLGVWKGLRFVIVALPGLFLTFFYSTGCSKAVVPVLVLPFAALFYEAICACLNLSVFSSSWCRFVIVALPGLFSYLFFYNFLLLFTLL